MPLPSFVLTGTLNEILGEVASNELVQSAATRAVISLTSNHKSESPLVWDDEINWLEQPVTARVDPTGAIVNEEGDPLRLLARHEDLIPNLQWRISIQFPPSVLPPAQGGKLRSWTFDAGEDGETVQLSEATPIVTAHGLALPKGVRSSVVPITTGPNAGLLQWTDEYGNAFGDPVAPGDLIPEEVAVNAMAPFVDEIVDADIAARDFDSVDNGDGSYDITLGGVPFAGPIVAPAATVSSVAGLADRFRSWADADAYIDFTTKPNGDPPAVLDTGQTVDFLSPNGRKPQISSGKLVHGTLPASGQYAAYYQAVLDGDCHAAGTQWTIDGSDGSTTQSVATLVIWDNVYDPGTVMPVPKHLIHLTCTTIPSSGLVTVGFWVSDGADANFVQVKSWSCVAPASDGVAVWEMATFIDLDAKVVHVKLPGDDSVTGEPYVTITEAQIQTGLTGLGKPSKTMAELFTGSNVVVVEHYANSGNTARYPHFLNMWGDVLRVGRKARTALEEKAGLPAAVAANLPAVFIDPRPMADGSITALTKGQFHSTFGNRPLVIDDGKILHDAGAVASGNIAGYLIATLPGKATRIGCVAYWPTGATTAVVALAAPKNPGWNTANNGVATDSPVHVTVAGDGAVEQSKYRVSDGTLQNRKYGKFNNGRTFSGNSHVIEVLILHDEQRVVVTVDNVRVVDNVDAAWFDDISSTAVWETFSAYNATPAQILYAWAEPAATASNLAIPSTSPSEALAAAPFGMMTPSFLSNGDTATQATTTNVAETITLTPTYQFYFPPSGLAIAYLGAWFSTTGPLLIQCNNGGNPVQVLAAGGSGRVNAFIPITGTPGGSLTTLTFKMWATSGVATMSKGGSVGAVVIGHIPTL